MNQDKIISACIGLIGTIHGMGQFLMSPQQDSDLVAGYILLLEKPTMKWYNFGYKDGVNRYEKTLDQTRNIVNFISNN